MENADIEDVYIFQGILGK